MTIRLELNRIAPGVEIGPHRHPAETIVYLAGGELVFEHGDGLGLQTLVRGGDVLYEAPAEMHRIRNDGAIDALALLAAVDPDASGLAVLAQRWHAAVEPVRRRGEARKTVGDGMSRTFLVEPGDFGSVAFTVTEIELEPGAADTWHRHPGSEHAIVVFEGRGTIAVGGVEETLEPLKGIRVLPGQPHRVINDGRRRLRYFVCASPGTDPTIDRRAAAAPPRSADA